MMSLRGAQRRSNLIIVITILGLILSTWPLSLVQAAAKPAIVITSYSTSPSSIDPGDQFTLILTLKNKGSAEARNISVSISGNSFNPTDSSNTDFVTSLASNSQTTVSFNLQSDGSTSSTRENLTVDFAYEDASDNTYISTQTISISFTRKAGEQSTAKPRLMVSNYATTPAIIKPGQRFTLKLKVKNNGNATAYNTVSAVSTTAAKVLSSASKKYISKIAKGKTKQLSFRMKADKGATSTEATIELTYEDSSQNSFTSTQTVSLIIGTSLVKKAVDLSAPRVLIASYETNPSEIVPGERFGLDLNVKNITGKAVKNVVITVSSASSDSEDSSTSSDSSSSSSSGADSSSSSSSAESFAAVDSSNVRFISSMASKAEEKVYFNMMAGPSVTPGLYNLAINISYLDAKNKKTTSTESIGLIVKRKPSLSLIVNKLPSKLLVGDDYNLSFDVYNLSDFTVKGVIISALGEGITADINKDSKFIGSIESSDSETIEVNGNTSLAGEKGIILRVQYRDDFGQTRAVERPLKINVKEQKAKVTPTTLDKGSKKGKSFFSKVIDFFKALLGLG